MLLEDIDKIKKTDKIRLKCDRCGVNFDRVKWLRTKSFAKWENKDYCKKCAMGLSSILSKEKQRQTHIEKMRSMTAEERKKKYGNDTWKRVPQFIAQHKSKDGHGAAVKAAIAKMTVEERKTKYGLPGERNPMYGRPAPEGSGIGYSGWYKGIFFRSKLELSYILHMKDNSIIPAESVFSIRYIGLDGQPRTYRPDFIINKSTVVEIKPYNLVDNDENKLKIESARTFFRESSYDYNVVTERDFEVISFDNMWKMYNDGIITLCSHSERRIRSKYESKES